MPTLFGPSSPRQARLPAGTDACTPPAGPSDHADGVPPILDLRSGQNRLGAPEAVLRAAREALHERRPEALVAQARRTIASYAGVAEDEVVLGHGARDLLWSTARALVEPGDRWLSVEPAITPFAQAARAVGAKLTRWRAVERSGYRVDLDQIAELMRLVEPKLVSLSAPANPSGAPVPWSALCDLAAAFDATRFIVDQSWLSLSTEHATLAARAPANLIRIRSLSVELGLTGLRAGYQLCAPELATRIDGSRAPLSVSAPAAAAIAAALQQPDHLARCRRTLQQDAAGLRRMLDSLALTHAPAVTPFALVRIARAQQIADDLASHHGIAVYDATATGLPDHVRICAPDANELERLRTALESVFERHGLVRGR